MLRFGYGVEHAPGQRCRCSSDKAMPKSSAASFDQTSKGKPGLRVAAVFLARRRDNADSNVNILRLQEKRLAEDVEAIPISGLQAA